MEQKSEPDFLASADTDIIARIRILYFFCSVNISVNKNFLEEIRRQRNKRKPYIPSCSVVILFFEGMTGMGSSICIVNVNVNA